MSKCLILLAFSFLGLMVSAQTYASNYSISYDEFKLLEKKEQLLILERLQSLAVAWEAQVPKDDGPVKKTTYTPNEMEQRFVYLMSLLVSVAHAQDGDAPDESNEEEATAQETEEQKPETEVEETKAVDANPDRWLDYVKRVDDEDKCMYAGWVSIMKKMSANDVGRCVHPTNLGDKGIEGEIKKAYLAQEKHYLENPGDDKEKCTGNSIAIVCNPAMFGNMAACVPSGKVGQKEYSRNSSMACFGKYKGLSPERKEELLKDILSDNAKATYFAEILKTAYQMCVCNTGVSNNYSKYMFYHRTCFGLMSATQDILSQPTIQNSYCQIDINPDQSMNLRHFVSQIQKNVNDNIEARLAAYAAKNKAGDTFVEKEAEGRKDFEERARKEYDGYKESIKDIEAEYKSYYLSNNKTVGAYTGEPPKDISCDIAAPKDSCTLKVSLTKGEETEEGVTFKATVTSSGGYQLTEEDEIIWSAPGITEENKESTTNKKEITIKGAPGDIIKASVKPKDSDITCTDGEAEIEADDCELVLTITPPNGDGLVTATAVQPGKEDAKFKWSPEPVEGADSTAATATFKDPAADTDITVSLADGDASCKEKTDKVPKKEAPKECSMEFDYKELDANKFEVSVNSITFTDGSKEEGEDIKVKWRVKQALTAKSKLIKEKRQNPEGEDYKVGDEVLVPLGGGAKSPKLTDSRQAKDLEVTAIYKEGDKECTATQTIKKKEDPKSNIIDSGQFPAGGQIPGKKRMGGGAMGFGTRQ